MKKITALGRPVDINYPTNRIIILFSLLFMAIVLIRHLVTAAPFFEALITALVAGLALFLGWAFAREIDPASEWSAFVALPVIVGANFIFGSPSLLALFFMILFSRVLNRCTGVPAKKGDSLLLLVMGALLYNSGFVSALPVLTLVFLIDAYLEPRHRKQTVFALSTLILFFFMTFIYPAGEVLASVGALNLPLYIIPLLVVAVVMLYFSRPLPVLDDLGTSSLSYKRIQSVRIVAALYITAELLLQGYSAILHLYPALFVYGGTGLYHLVNRYYKVS